MTAQFVGPKNDVKKSSSFQVVDFFCLVFDLIGLPRALIDEAPDRLGVRHTQAMRLLHFVVPLELFIAGSDKMRPAKRFAIKRRTDCLVTALDTALSRVRHSRKAQSVCKSVFNDTFVQDHRPTLPLVSSFSLPQAATLAPYPVQRRLGMVR